MQAAVCAAIFTFALCRNHDCVQLRYVLLQSIQFRVVSRNRVTVDSLCSKNCKWAVPVTVLRPGDSDSAEDGLGAAWEGGASALNCVTSASIT